jgi:MFS family permease
MRIAETPVFTEANAKRPKLRVPAIEALRRHPRNFLVVIGARLAENGLGYLFPVFGLGYVINTLHMSREVAITGVMLGNFAEMICIVLASWLSDKIGRRPVYMGGALFSALFAFPFFLMVGTRNPVMISLAFILIMGIGGGGMFGPQAAYFAELFGPRLRYSGFAFARELGSIIAGGPSPLIAALLVGWLAGAPWGVACYVILLSLLTALAVWWGPETTHSDIRAEHPEDREVPEVASTIPAQ